MTRNIRVLDIAFAVSDLKPMTKLVLVNMARLGNNTAQCWASQQLLADMCGCARRTVQRHQRILRKLDYIYRAPNKNTRTTLYILRHSVWNQDGFIVRKDRTLSPVQSGQNVRQNPNMNPKLNHDRCGANKRGGAAIPISDSLCHQLASLQEAVEEQENLKEKAIR